MTRLNHTRAAAQQLANKRAALRAQELRTEIITTLSQPGRGRTYTDKFLMVGGQPLPIGGKRNKPHTASAPGDPPAVDSGDLRNSIGVQKIKDGHYRVGTNKKHGVYMEFGTRKVAARPWLRPSLEKLRSRRG
ncbi:hypothetical protein DEIPH_ctg041orf0008 [Deinococcus phoenicis]|uniref:HK97 gp10 family phage protein n=1 Tax=Deinococcus phoenicis TaxID=1476583 RepID=A0A016QNF2_9DEIO|nr:HK97 gp10 family phage protein [Deinococcus phoenicis]EYB67412.1 hypothetical protein DEIPH_ctg041orf0008 [Deinococcus phoenicis]